MNALLVSAGRRVELLELLRRACQGMVIAVDTDRLAPALYGADLAATVPPVSDPAFVARLRELCVAHSVSLVVPTTDRELSVLSQRAPELEAVGARVAIGHHDAVVTALDKLTCASVLDGVGVSAIPTARWVSEDPPPFPFPVVVKPRQGAAAEGVRVIRAAAQWTAPPEEEEWLVQPLVPGPEVTIDVLASDDGRIVCLGARRRLKVRGGEVERAQTVAAEPYLTVAERIARALALAGPFNFQVFIGPETPLVGEVNPRLGGGLPLSEHAGAGILSSLCAWAGNGRWSADGPATAEAGLYMTRHDQSLFLRPSDVAW
jgi:carbamoyl-phosphate synthase large subunit